VKLSWRRRSGPSSSSAVSAGKTETEGTFCRHRSGPGTASHALKVWHAKRTCGTLNQFLHNRITCGALVKSHMCHRGRQPISQIHFRGAEFLRGSSNLTRCGDNASSSLLLMADPPYAARPMDSKPPSRLKALSSSCGPSTLQVGGVGGFHQRRFLARMMQTPTSGLDPSQSGGSHGIRVAPLFTTFATNTCQGGL
jgi:hypothetical protein